MFASIFVVGGVNALRNASALGGTAAPLTEKIVPAAKKAAPQLPIPEDPTTLVRINAATQIVAGLGLATGRAPRLCSLVLAGSLVPTTAAGHAFWTYEDRDERAQHLIHFFKNVSLMGGLLIAAGDTEGQPSLGWRARRAAKNVRKEARRNAKQVSTSARREAKLAKAKVT